MNVRITDTINGTKRVITLEEDAESDYTDGLILDIIRLLIQIHNLKKG